MMGGLGGWLSGYICCQVVRWALGINTLSCGPDTESGSRYSYRNNPRSIKDSLHNTSACHALLESIDT